MIILITLNQLLDFFFLSGKLQFNFYKKSCEREQTDALEFMTLVYEIVNKTADDGEINKKNFLLLFSKSFEMKNILMFILWTTHMFKPLWFSRQSLGFSVKDEQTSLRLQKRLRWTFIFSTWQNQTQSSLNISDTPSAMQSLSNNPKNTNNTVEMWIVFSLLTVNTERDLWQNVINTLDLKSVEKRFTMNESFWRRGDRVMSSV